MSRQIRETENYFWNVKDTIGSGATSSVYKGRHSKTGEACAVKTFNHQYVRNTQVQKLKREFDVVRALDHENMVKLLAIETEKTRAVNRASRFRKNEGWGTGSDVIIMEYCSAGSLFTVLSQPQNAYGLDDDELLLLLKCLAEGMSYLRSKNIVHRDIKPGNILLQELDSGERCYKLTDFGAARQLEDEEQFMSIVGTEEYLHPDMYERALLNGEEKSYNSSVDLWSLGVTLYHAVTGSLPFRPFRYDRSIDSRKIMHQMTTKKATGVISGIQMERNGPIAWHQSLPETCVVSLTLRERLTPMLAKLMECDPKKNWTYEQFFAEARAILNAYPFHIFQPLTGDFRRIYLEQPSVACVQNAANDAWHLEVDNIMLLRSEAGGLQLEPSIKEIPNHGDSKRRPPILIATKNHQIMRDLIDIQGLESLELPPTDIRSDFLARDLDYSRRCLKILNQLTRKARHVDQQIHLYTLHFEALHAYVYNEISTIADRLPDRMHAIEATCDFVKAVVNLSARLEQHISVAEVTATERNHNFTKIVELDKSAKDGERVTNEYHLKIIDRCCLREKWNAIIRIETDPNALKSVGELCRVAEVIVKVFTMDKRHGTIDAAIQRTHPLDVQKLFNLYNTGSARLQARLRVLAHVHSAYGKWSDGAYSILTKTHKLNDFFQSLDARRASSEKWATETTKKLSEMEAFVSKKTTKSVYETMSMSRESQASGETQVDSGLMSAYDDFYTALDRNASLMRSHIKEHNVLVSKLNGL